MNLPHRFVFLFGLLFGGGLVFLSPPFSAADELAHFLRAYHCAEGKLYAVKCNGNTGDNLPSSLTETYVAIADMATKDEEYSISRAKINKAAAIALEPERRQFTVFANTALYSPVPYWPQSAAIWAARFWRPSPLVLLYLARAASLIVYLLMAAAAVRIVPIQKWALALVALVPMAVYLAASLSADTVTLGLALLIVALTLNLTLGSGMPRRRNWLGLGLLLVLLALSKQGYLGLALLFFLIPGKKFSSPARRWLIAAVMIGLPLAVGAAWAYSLRGLYVPILPFVDPPAQLRSILANPWSYAGTVGKAMYQWDMYSLMIGVFGWLGAHLPNWIRQTYWTAMGLVAVLDGGKPLALSYGAKAVAFGTYVCTFAVMATCVYLSWEQVGIKSIGGIQPRYFLPIVPLLLLLPRGTVKLASSRFSRAVVPTVAMSVAVLAAGCTCWTLMKRYYW